MVGDVVTAAAVPVLVTAIGSVQSISTVMVKSRIDGEIAKVNFEEGQQVNEGDVLFTLDDRAVRAQLQQAEANLERDRAQLDDVNGRLLALMDNVHRLNEEQRPRAVASMVDLLGSADRPALSPSNAATLSRRSTPRPTSRRW